MPKLTDTREKTRAAHALFVARGEAPSARQILRHIGAGSLSTISDELAKIDSSGPTPGAPAALPPEAIQAPTLPNAEIPTSISHELAMVAVAISNLSDNLESLRAELIELRTGSAEQLRIAYERYEAVQRIALQQVDIARQEARDYKARLAALTLDSDTREDAIRGRAQQLRDENQQLLGRIEELSSRNG